MNGIKRRRTTVLLIITLSVFVLLIWFSRTTHTGEQAQVLKVHEEAIEILNLNGRITTVSIPKGISKLIDENQQYFIQYEKRRWQQPRLVSIEPFK